MDNAVFFRYVKAAKSLARKFVLLWHVLDVVKLQCNLVYLFPKVLS